MIVQEKISEDLVKTYSNSHRKIIQDGTGHVYEQAVDPISAGRTYTESEEFVDTQEASDVVVYSKWKIMEYLMERNYYAEFKNWLRQNDYEDYWTIPLEYEEGNVVFERLLGLFKEHFGFTEHQIDEMKAYSMK